MPRLAVPDHVINAPERPRTVTVVDVISRSSGTLVGVHWDNEGWRYYYRDEGALQGAKIGDVVSVSAEQIRELAGVA